MKPTANLNDRNCNLFQIGTTPTSVIGNIPFTSTAIIYIRRPLVIQIHQQLLYFFLTNMADNTSSSNPASSQIMPERMKRSVQKAEAEIEEISERWKKLLSKKEKLLQRMDTDSADIKRLKGEIKDRENRINNDNLQVDKIVREFAVLQAQVNEKQSWIDQCNALYP